MRRSRWRWPRAIPDGDRVTYSATGLPEGLTIHPTTGVISGTLSYASAGTHPVSVTATDTALATGSTTFTWTVTDVNRAPVLTAVADQTSAENAAITLAVAASDPDGNSLTYSATGLPPALTIHPATGVISGTLSYASAGTHPVTVTATDTALATGSTTFTWTVTDVNRAPVLTAVADQTSAEHATITLPLVASDPDGTALTYSATGLPPALTINAATGVISGTLSFTSAGAHTVTVTATDLAGATGSTNFTWTVTNVNRPPVLTAVADQTSAENAAITLALVASDPDGDTLTYSATGLPAGLTIAPTTGVISGTLSYASAGTHAVTVTATDTALATGSTTFTWTVTDVNRAPVLTAVADQISAENATITLAVVRERSGRRQPDLQRDGAAASIDDSSSDWGDQRDAQLRERRDASGDGDGHRHRVGDRQPDLHVDGDRREPRAGADGGGRSDERRERDDHAAARGERSGWHRADLQRDRACRPA